MAAPAGARPLHATALGNRAAVGAALAAARSAPPADRLAVFAETYAETAADGTTAEAVKRLLGEKSMSSALPTAVARATVLAPTSAPAPALDAAALLETRAPAAPTGQAVRADRQQTATPPRPAPPSRPRAP